MTGAVFAAIMAPETIRITYGALAKKMPPNWEIKNPANYHFSLAYLDQLTNPDKLETASNLLKKAVQKFRDTSGQDHIALGMDGLSYFINHSQPTKRKKTNETPHVFFGRPSHEASNDIISLHNKIIGVLRAHGFPFGRLQINPHMTIAKVPQSDLDVMEAFERVHGALAMPPQPVRTFGLYRNTQTETAAALRKSGQIEPPKYELLEEFDLGLS
jgi:2'-5' RNA ligase